MEQIISMEEALKELRDKNEENVEQFSNPKKVKSKISGRQIILRQLLAVLLIILTLLLIKLMIPDLYEQVSDYLNIRFGVMP